jgi:hypothetical protein
MSPGRKKGRKERKVREGPWRIHFFQRPGDRAVPGRDFLELCPVKVRQTMLAVLKAVADAPPRAFSGGGYWEAMHDDMAGYYEIRVDGPDRRHYRLFCLLEREGEGLGLGGPSIVIIVGKDKAFRTTLSKRDYEQVRALGNEYRSRTPRSVAT